MLFGKIVGAVVGLVAFAVAGTVAGAEWRGTAAITFLGSSTLHDFGGSVTAAPVRVVTVGDGAALTWSASGELAVTNMTTKHGGRDAKMMKMFSAVKWPTIRAATLANPPLVAGATGCIVRVEITGVTNDLPAAVTNWIFSADALSFEVAFPLSLKAFALQAPSVLGVIGVADRVEVQGRVAVKRVMEQP